MQKPPFGLTCGVLGSRTRNQQGEWKYVNGKVLNEILHVNLTLFRLVIRNTDGVKQL